MPSSPSYPSAVYRHITQPHSPFSLDTSLAQLVRDLGHWSFDPNETHSSDIPGLRRGEPASMLQGFLNALPRNLSGEAVVVAQRLAQALVAAGADPTVRDLHDRPLEDLAPASLREAMVALRGGSVATERQMRQLKQIVEQDMNHHSPVSSLRQRLGRATPGPPGARLMGLPAPLAVALCHRSWSNNATHDPHVTPALSRGRDTVSTARARAGHMRQIAKWLVYEIPGKDLQPALSVMECICLSLAQPLALRSADFVAVWQEAADAMARLAARPRLAPGHLPGIDQALDGRWGPMTGHAAQAIAHGLLAFPLGDGLGWARAVACMMETSIPERLWHVGSQGLEANKGRAFVQALVGTNQLPHPGAPAWNALMECLSGEQGAQLMAAALAETVLRRSPPAQETAHACAVAWARAYPSTAPAMEAQLRQAASASLASSQPAVEAAAVRLRAACMDIALPEAPSLPRTPTGRM